MLDSRRILSRGPRPPAFGGVHPSLEITPTPLRQFDITPRNRSAVLADGVKEDQEIARAAIENPVERASAVATQLPQWTGDL
jgi:hypothetical protein